MNEHEDTNEAPLRQLPALDGETAARQIKLDPDFFSDHSRRLSTR